MTDKSLRNFSAFVSVAREHFAEWITRNYKAISIHYYKRLSAVLR